MSIEIINLEPKAVWKNFYKLTQVPRPSKKEEKIIAFIKKFGEDLGLETIKDHVGNIIIRKPATPGMENRKPVVLQGHLDMVPQKNSDKVHDFEKDPIDARIEGEWVKASGTTLGADNGMGCAAAMTVLEDKDIAHGPIEAFFTVDEETGMTGAFGLKKGLLKGEILMNLDSEDEGELYVGCAGGTNASIKFSYKEDKVPADAVAFNITLKGLKGGHSGLDINLGRGNANKILNRFLKYVSEKITLHIASFEGGNLRNAIPRESFATVAIAKKDEKKFLDLLAQFLKVIKSELSGTEPDLSLKAEPAVLPKTAMDEKTMKTFLNAVYACPNGVIRMSDSVEGLVETSTNLSTIKLGNKEIEIYCLLRSSVTSANEDLQEMIKSVFELAGAKEITFDGTYPGWKPNMQSEILQVMLQVYKELYDKTPQIKAIHAGLECGLLGGTYPNLDMISFGATIRHPHSPDEKINIATVEKFWRFLAETLKNVPEKKK